MTEPLRVRIDWRPVCVNEERKMTKYPRAEFVRNWREAFEKLARAQRPARRFDQVHITVVHHRLNRRSMPDVGGCLPSAKAAIDGLVDAGVLPADDPKHVLQLTFVAPVVSGYEALELIVTEAA